MKWAKLLPNQGSQSTRNGIGLFHRRFVPLPLDMLVDCPQRRPEDPLKLAPLVVAELADIGIHGVDPESCEGLRPFVSKVIQVNCSPAAGRGVFGELETPAIVIVLHAVLPPIEPDLLITMGTRDALKIRTAVEKLDLIRQLDLNLVGIGSDLTKQAQR